MSIESYEAKARQYQAEGKWADALSLLQLAVEENPHNSFLYSLIGDTLLNMEHWEEAAASYKKSLAIEKNFDWAWHNLAFVLGKLNRWQEVRDCHQNLSKIKPDFWHVNGKVPLVQTHWSAYSEYLEADKLGVEYVNSTSYSRESRTIEHITELSDYTYLATFSCDVEDHNTIEVAIQPSSDRNSSFYWTTWDAGKKTGNCLFSCQQTDLESARISLIERERERKLVYHISDQTKNNKGIDELLSKMDENSRLMLFKKLSDYQINHNNFSLSFIHYDLFRSIISELSKESTLKMDYGCWLAPNVAYFEASIEDTWLLGWFDVAVNSSQFFRVAKSYSFQISEKKIAGIIVFSEDVYRKAFQQFSFTFFDSEQKISLSDTIHSKSYSLECIQYINKKSESQRSLITELVNYGLISCMHQQPQRYNVMALVSKFQQYVLISDRNPLNKELPFQMFFDQVIPIGYDGFFLIGWLHDPFESLEEIEVITDLGFKFKLFPEEIYRFSRKDVVEHLRKTKYGNFPTKPGFCAYAKADTETKEKIANVATFHGVRFNVKLNSGVTVNIVPKIKFYDHSTARKVVTKVVGSDQLTENMLDQCIGPAASKLQELCIQKVAIDEVLEIGQLPNDPTVSVIVPIYERYDFQKVQIALFANDQSLRENVEIIYVLDSPWQKFEFTTFMKQHCKLYEFPAKVIIMKRNSGYSSANNAGAKHAKGKYILLMNSDVFPCADGWAMKMVEFFKSSEKIGTVGGKLIYEDGSLQHAGMFFGKTTYPFWQNLHYYKGFPNAYLPAQKNRKVPAVTGACLMIARDLYTQVGGLSTDYVIGDFEDSDLCLKCTEKGYENWYYPAVEFYHLERQSVPLNPSYSESLAWRYNAKLHYQKWNNLISQIMNDYHQ